MSHVKNSSSASLSECKELNKLINNFKSSYYKNRAENFAKKQALSQLLKWGARAAAGILGAAVAGKKIAGTSAGIIVGVLYPSDLGTNTIVYGKSLERINEMIAEEGNLNTEKLKKELENLKIASKGIQIELEWGNKAECYRQLEVFTKDLVNSIYNSLEQKDNTSNNILL